MQNHDTDFETAEISAPDAQSLSPERIGQRLRELRKEKGMTILVLAAQSGISAGMISQIERGKSNPSIKTLQSLRAALGVNFWEFLEGTEDRPKGEDPVFVRRASRRLRTIVGETRLVKELLSPQADQNLRFMFVTVPPGGYSEDVLVGAGQKGGYVMSGEVDLTVGEQVVTLREGDSFQFRCDVPHKITNNSKHATKLFWIMSVVDTHL